MLGFFDEGLSNISAGQLFSNYTPHTAPGYTRRIYSSVDASRMIGKQYTCLTKAVKNKQIKCERLKNGDYRFSMSDIVNFMLHEKRRPTPRPWTEDEIGFLLTGLPVNRTESACRVMRSKIKGGYR